MIEYNVLIENFIDTFDLLKIPEEDLIKIVEAYNLGKEEVFIDGEEIVLKGLRKLKLYSYEGSWEKLNEFRNLPETRKIMTFSRLTGKYALHPASLEKVGKDVTREYLKKDYGWNRKDKVDDNILMLKRHYINIERIEQLKQLKSTDFDFKKLIRICEEINIAYNLDCFYAVGNLLRSMLDHIAPVLGHVTFKEVANNYAGSKSFKEAMQSLDSSLRKISDGFLHLPIRKTEILPTINQVEYLAPIDLLLGEVVRITSEKQ